MWHAITGNSSERNKHIIQESFDLRERCKISCSVPRFDSFTPLKQWHLGHQAHKTGYICFSACLPFYQWSTLRENFAFDDNNLSQSWTRWACPLFWRLEKLVFLVVRFPVFVLPEQIYWVCSPILQSTSPLVDWQGGWGSELKGCHRKLAGYWMLYQF